MKRLILLLLLVCSAPAWAEVYKWVDADGKVHYSDRADSKSQVQKLPEFQYKSPVPTQAPSGSREPGPPAGQGTSAGDFPSGDPLSQPAARFDIQIVTPTQDATVRDNQGIVPVVIQTTPRPGRGVLYQVYLDGKAWYQPFEGQKAYLSNVDRGTHSIHVVMLSSTGRTLGKSNSVTFHLHRRSILHPKPR